MYTVEVEQGNLRFSAAHFILLGSKCERLHGHNYAVSVTLEGSLGEDRYLWDFVELKSIVRGICERLDHRFLLPAHCEYLEIKKNDDEWEIRFENLRYVFPARDVLVLPLDSITAERLAEYICAQIVSKLHEKKAGNIASIIVGVEEAPGQSAYYHGSFN